MPAVHTTIRLLTEPTQRSTGWQVNALCRTDAPAELFFPVGTSGPAVAQAEAAKAVCRRCPVREECLSWALDVLEFGVAGGLDEEERRVVRRQRAANRNAVTA